MTLPNLVVDPVHSRVIWKGVTYGLTGRSMETLRAMAELRQMGQVMMRANDVGRRVWRGWDVDEQAQCARTYACYLRRILPGLMGGWNGWWWLNLTEEDACRSIEKIDRRSRAVSPRWARSTSTTGVFRQDWK